MDILAARKKAAEQASARNKLEQEAAAPAARPKQEQEKPAAKLGQEQEEPAAQPGQEQEEPAAQPVQEQEASPVPAVSLPGAIIETPAAVTAGQVVEESRDKAVTIPVSSASETEETQQEEIELLSFRLGGEEYAVLVADVREVLKVYQLTIVPNTPDYILGIMSLRGTMLPVIDLCKRFGLALGAKDEKSRIVVVSSADEGVGLLVDRVMGVFTVLPDEIKPAPENVEKGAEFLRGIVRKDEKLYILLDLEKAVGV